MNTAHQVLSEVAKAGQRREEESKEWNKLVRECRTSRWLAVVWLGIFAFFGLVGALVMFRHLVGFGFIYLAPVAFLAVTSPLIFAGQRRRERALFALIAREAPDLSQKLRTEGIAQSGSRE